MTIIQLPSTGLDPQAQAERDRRNAARREERAALRRHNAAERAARITPFELARDQASGAKVAPIDSAWRADATCSQVPGEVFFPAKAGSGAYDPARRLCMGCSARAVCLENVMDSEPAWHRFGLVAGLTPTERTALFAEFPGRWNPPALEAEAM